MDASPERSLVMDPLPEDSRPAAPPNISAVLPVFEERDAIPEVVAELERALQGTGRSYEIGRASCRERV